jgi:hypothetical protein
VAAANSCSKAMEAATGFDQSRGQNGARANLSNYSIKPVGLSKLFFKFDKLGVKGSTSQANQDNNGGALL